MTELPSKNSTKRERLSRENNQPRARDASPDSEPTPPPPQTSIHRPRAHARRVAKRNETKRNENKSRTSINSALHRSIDGVDVACTDVDAPNAELIRRRTTANASHDERDDDDASVPLAARRSIVSTRRRLEARAEAPRDEFVRASAVPRSFESHDSSSTKALKVLESSPVMKGGGRLRPTSVRTFGKFCVIVTWV